MVLLLLLLLLLLMMMMMMMMTLSTFIAHDSVNLNAKYTEVEGGRGGVEGKS